jgi:hypothetical protein
MVFSHHLIALDWIPLSVSSSDFKFFSAGTICTFPRA